MSLGSELARGWQIAERDTSKRAEQRPVQGRQSRKTALLASASTIASYSASAQEPPTPAAELPQLNVEATAKKKAPAKKAAAKKAAPTQAVSPAPQPAPVQASTTATTGEPGANPYANPN